MTNMFDKWDEAIDIEGIKKDIAEAAANGDNGNYKEVPHGNYEVSVQQMELVASKKGDPMVSIWFKVVEGEYKGNIIFYNQVITRGFQIHNCNELLHMMVSEMSNPPIIEFQTYKQYKELLMDIFEGVANNFEYALKYTPKKKNTNFSDFEITEVFVLE